MDQTFETNLFWHKVTEIQQNFNQGLIVHNGKACLLLRMMAVMYFKIEPREGPLKDSLAFICFVFWKFPATCKAMVARPLRPQALSARCLASSHVLLPLALLCSLLSPKPMWAVCFTDSHLWCQLMSWPPLRVTWPMGVWRLQQWVCGIL